MPEIDLHGMTLEQALIATRKALHKSFCSGSPELRIITGRGLIYAKVLEMARKDPLVGEVLNDGPLGKNYQGQVVIRFDFDLPRWQH